MSDNSSRGGFNLSPPLINFMVILIGVVSAYYLTIQSLKVDLAAKAETAVVEAMDRKLAAFEVLLKEGVVGREQFYLFSRDIEARLIRIEYYLTEKPGAKIGKP